MTVKRREMLKMRKSLEARDRRTQIGVNAMVGMRIRGSFGHVGFLGAFGTCGTPTYKKHKKRANEPNWEQGMKAFAWIVEPHIFALIKLRCFFMIYLTEG